MKRLNKRMVIGLVLVAILLATLTSPVWAQGGTTRFSRLIVSQLLTVTGDTTLDDATIGDDLTVTDNMAANDTIVADFETVTPQTSLLLTMNGWLTPTGTLQPIRAAGAVSINSTRIAPGFDGQKLHIINFGANAVTITETAPHIMAGNFAIGAGDTLTMVYSGTAWVELSRSNN